MNITISYQAATVADFIAAIEAARELGVSPIIAAPAIVPPKRNAAEPNVIAYLEARGETIFRLTKAEKAAGLSRDEAAGLRMQADGWQAGEAEAAEAPPPWDGSDTF